ncbi:uncharacterized protein VTP21DRAFT_2401 [Calcarisporiella thermophila]|uniref:uncharacterized protein n=1 Tax=Calcarisporiella thermophila TaxID=911321 RepID=UPI003742AE5D
MRPGRDLTGKKKALLKVELAGEGGSSGCRRALGLDHLVEQYPCFEEACARGCAARGAAGVGSPGNSAGGTIFSRMEREGREKSGFTSRVAPVYASVNNQLRGNAAITMHSAAEQDEIPNLTILVDLASLCALAGLELSDVGLALALGFPVSKTNFWPFWLPGSPCALFLPLSRPWPLF